MPESPFSRPLSKPALVLLVVLPLLKLALHLAVGAGYGYHGDELYYLVCADHLDWAYVDHPPVSIFVLAVTRLMVGQSVMAIRLVPALAGALTVFIVGAMARDMEGGPFAMALAMVAVIASPFYRCMGGYYSMNSLDVLCWAIAAWIVLRILSGGSPRLWILLGVVLGIGLENKISVLWLEGGLAVGLLLTAERRLLWTRGPWLAGLISLVLAAPYAIWQFSHNFATLHFMKDAAENRVVVGPLSFFGAVIDGMSTLAAPVWIAGLVFFLILPAGRSRRAMGWAWLAVMAVLAFSGAGKAYYAAAAFPWLLAAGGVAIERWLRTSTWPGRVLIVAYTVLLLLGSRGNARIVLPILPQKTIADYSLRTGVGRRVEQKRSIGKLPDFLGMMAGWDENLDSLNDVYKQLPEADRSNTTILASFYQLASAIDVLGPARGLPPASSGHNNYWFWGFHGSWDQPLLAVGYSEESLRELFKDVTLKGHTRCEYCGYPDMPIYLVRGVTMPPEMVWKRMQLTE